MEFDIKKVKSVYEVDTNRVFSRMSYDENIFEYNFSDSHHEGKNNYLISNRVEYSENIISEMISDGRMLIEDYDECNCSKCKECKCNEISDLSFHENPLKDTDYPKENTYISETEEEFEQDLMNNIKPTSKRDVTKHEKLMQQITNTENDQVIEEECNCDKANMYDNLLKDYNQLCISSDSLSKSYIESINRYEELAIEFNKLYSKVIEVFNRYSTAYAKSIHNRDRNKDYDFLAIRQLEGRELASHILNTYKN